MIDWVGVAAAIAATGTCVSVIITAIGQARAAERVNAVEEGVKKGNAMSDGRLTALLDRQEVLIKALVAHGISVPPRAPES